MNTTKVMKELEKIAKESTGFKQKRLLKILDLIKSGKITDVSSLVAYVKGMFKTPPSDKTLSEWQGIVDLVSDVMDKYTVTQVGDLKVGDEVYYLFGSKLLKVVVRGFTDDGKHFYYNNEKHLVKGLVLLARKEYPSAKPINKRNSLDEQTYKREVTTAVKYLYEEFYLSGKVNFNPFYQRDLVWSLEQKQFYLKNLFEMKADIRPSFIYYSFEKYKETGFEYEVLDGKQRLNAIYDFIEGKFPLENGMYFKDLNFEDVRYLMKKEIRYTVITNSNSTEEDLTDEVKIELFLEANDYGTAMDKSHLEKVKDM